MLHVVLHRPEIPPNTGNIMRLCANTGCGLHLIHPLGFELDDRRMRRAGLDYRDFAEVAEYGSVQDFVLRGPGRKLYAVDTWGERRYSDANFQRGDALLFGSETRGLPSDLLEDLGPAAALRIPMRENSRSLNLANSVALVLYEGLRQLGFEGLS